MSRKFGKLAPLLASLLLLGCGATDDAYLFRYGHSQSAQAARSQSMIFFKEEIEKPTNGRIRVENYFSATLGSEREMMDMVATGALQGTRGGLFANANPKFVIFMLPFLVSNWDEAARLVNSELTRKINEDVREILGRIAGPNGTPQNKSSLRVDIENERPSEIDYINGAVVKRR